MTATESKTAAQLLQDVAQSNPTAHNRALARGYGLTGSESSESIEIANSYEFQFITGYAVAQELHSDDPTLTRFDVVWRTKNALYLRGEPAPTGPEIAGMAHYFDTLED